MIERIEDFYSQSDTKIYSKINEIIDAINSMQCKNTIDDTVEKITENSKSNNSESTTHN